MKAWEYALVRGVSKIFERIQKDNEEEELQLLKSGNQKLDKGSWVYNSYTQIYDFIPPPKNLHYVTEQKDGDTLTVILSKRPISWESQQFDYPWDAEFICEIAYYSEMDQYTHIIFKREAPMLIADNDIACPYCKNSRPPANWIRNTLKQELHEVPANITNRLDAQDFTLREFPLMHYWCPICCCQVQPEFLLQKGEEWKMQFIEDLTVNRVSPLKKKNILELERKERERPRTLREKLDNQARPLLQFNPRLITPQLHQGLIVKAVCHVTTKDKEIVKTKWFKASNGLPTNTEINPQATSYFHDDKVRFYLERCHKYMFPLRYFPVQEIDRNVDKYYQRNDNIIEEFKKKYHKGEALPIIKLYHTGEVLNDLEILDFICDMGFTHVPAIFFGNIKKKEEMEERFKEEVTIIAR